MSIMKFTRVVLTGGRPVVSLPASASNFNDPKVTADGSDIQDINLIC